MNDDSNPLVSIGIPTYNRADAYLKQALESAINQTYPNIEIIVSDNCSTDHTENLVKGFSNPRIRYYRHKENIGAINNFNYCLEQAKGTYFLMLHDDDLIDPDLVEACIKAISGVKEPGVIIAGTRLIDGNGKVVYESPNRINEGDIKDFFLGWFSSEVALYLCSTLYHTKRLKELGGFHSKTDHFLDVVATVQLASAYGRIDVYDVKASFRRHSENMGGSGNPSKVSAWSEDSLFLLDVMCGLLPNDLDKAEVRKLGNLYFTKKSYRLTSGITSPSTRLSTYFKVYKMFDYSYSPVHFWYDTHLGIYIRSFIRKGKQILKLAPSN